MRFGGEETDRPVGVVVADTAAGGVRRHPAAYDHVSVASHCQPIARDLGRARAVESPAALTRKANPGYS